MVAPPPLASHRFRAETRGDTHALTRPTHDDMYFPVPPPYAHLVPPINVVMWIAKVVVFGLLWRALAKGAEASSRRGEST